MVNFGKNHVPSTDSSMIRLSFLLIFTMHVNSYDPTDDFAVNCGNSGNFPFQNRTWVGDLDSKLFSLIEPQTGQPSVMANASQSSITSTVPFGTARLSYMEFTYSFPVSGGPKFVRLHFYPTSYNNFEPYNSLFSVKVGQYTLLKDFNASLVAVVNGKETFFREYCINVAPGHQNQKMNVTFVPSTNHSYAYAFINGIEVVSMPQFLYYSDPNVEGFEFVGHDVPYQVENNTALQTLYRVNVGEKQIPPNDDTGMFRNWDDDARYLEKVYPYSLSNGFGLKLNYKGFPNYYAPPVVYLTARSYGQYEKAIFNVTWEFEVDSRFIYIVRLHFCEYDQHIKNVGDRVFQIFIAESLAEESADVILWSGGNLVPVHKDYAVQMLSEGSSKKVNFSIKLQRPPKTIPNRYHDVTLNGIEILKVSDNNNNLAGPNPNRLLSPPQASQPLTHSTKKSKKTMITIIVVAVAVSGLIMLVSIMGFIIISQRWNNDHDKDEKSRRRNSSTAAATSKSSKTQGSSLPSNLCRYFTINEIRAATNNFDEVFIIGVGGFGNVYKGYINDGSIPVAIKRLKPGSQQGAHEFMNEIELLSQLRHLHLVSLIGYCNEATEMILVYDFMQRGTLREYLYDSDNGPLQWKQRLEILLGAARGLHYLHAGAKHNIIHRDVKTTNILLDEKWVAKVSDFGLSKVGPTGTSRSHVSTVVKGSLGYLDPEYYKRQMLTLKSDVYSFGVVLLEALCGRPPVVRTVEKQRTSLVEWVKRCHERGEVDRTVDIFLKGTISPQCLKSYSQMALSCLLDDGIQRPSMSDVVGTLEFALQLVEKEEEDDDKFGGTPEEGKKNEERALLPKLMSDDGESGVRFTSSDESGSKSSKVTIASASSEEQGLVSAVVAFSETWDPTPR